MGLRGRRSGFAETMPRGLPCPPGKFTAVDQQLLSADDVRAMLDLPLVEREVWQVSILKLRSWCEAGDKFAFPGLTVRRVLLSLADAAHSDGCALLMTRRCTCGRARRSSLLPVPVQLVPHESRLLAGAPPSVLRVGGCPLLPHCPPCPHPVVAHTAIGHALLYRKCVIPRTSRRLPSGCWTSSCGRCESPRTALIPGALSASCSPASTSRRSAFTR
jgi:hypothetical protein